MSPGEGLTSLKTAELKKLLGILHKGQFDLPISAHSIACAGFQYKHAELMSAFRGVDEAGIRAVLVCVLAERLSQEKAALN